MVCAEENDTINSDFDFLILEKLVGVAGARFCHYFTSPIRVPLISEEDQFSNTTKSFLKIPA